MPVATVILLQHRLGISATWFKISRLKGMVLQTRLGGLLPPFIAGERGGLAGGMVACGGPQLG